VIGFPESSAMLNSTGVEFLLVDLDVALTFLKVADSTMISTTAERNHKNAFTAYEAVLHLLPKLRPTPSQRQTIVDKLAHLRMRLKAVGYQLP
jgi:hypothetical protein